MGILIIAVLIGLIPALIAQSKGRSFVLWWIYGAALFIVALPHSLLMSSEQGSNADLKQRALENSASRVPQPEPDFIADGVHAGIPFRNEIDGSVSAMIDGRVVRFRSLDALKSAGA